MMSMGIMTMKLRDEARDGNGKELNRGRMSGGSRERLQ